MKRTFIAGLMLATMVFSGYAQDSLVVEVLKRNTYDISLAGDGMEGKGAVLLRQALEGSQFAVVGEVHGIQEVGAFCRNLFLAATEEGYEYFVLETDPYIARVLEELAGEGIGALDSFTKKYPLAIPFYENKEDYDFLHTVVEHSDADPPVFWGVDQVFMAAPRYLFARLAAIAPDVKSRELALSWLTRAEEAYGAFLEKGNPALSILFKLEPDDFQELEYAFNWDKTGEALQIIADIERTQRVYGHWFGKRYFENNRERSLWMKEQFMDYYRRAAARGSLPKAVMKFGTYHAYRGLTPMSIYDIGNTASELAEMNGLHSVHIHFGALKGTAYNPLGGNVTFDAFDKMDPSVREAIADRTNGKGWILIDHRPLRKMPWLNLSDDLKTLVFSFDFRIIVPEAKAVTPFR